MASLTVPMTDRSNADKSHDSPPCFGRRFFLVRDAPFGGDLTFSEDALVLRQNAELADNYVKPSPSTNHALSSKAT